MSENQLEQVHTILSDMSVLTQNLQTNSNEQNIKELSKILRDTLSLVREQTLQLNPTPLTYNNGRNKR